jgi:hypothetical protein
MMMNSKGPFVGVGFAVFMALAFQVFMPSLAVGRLVQDAGKPAPKPAGGDTPKAEGDKLELDGLTLTVPAAWKQHTVETSGPMAPKAVLQIPAESGDPGTVRITHYPEMKGKDEMNIARWLGQVNQPDGKPSTKEQAKIENIEQGEVKLTLVDLSGEVKLTMRDQARPGYRMIAAIVNHPKGPHFIVAAGPAELMAKSKDQVLAFVKSAKVK